MSKRAVLVYGVGVEGKWNYPQFGLQLVEYDVKDQVGLGNCFVFNRTEAAVPATPGAIQYFAFEVPMGHYAYSGFNGVALAGGALAFRASEGRAVYLGDFVYTPTNGVELQRSAEGLDRAAAEIFGKSAKLSLAETIAVRPPKMFLCTP